ncbi:MAG: LytTR family DNA-binding domain-containing protein [Bacteroidota bacterium]
MISCIIIDDEINAREALDKIIKRYFSDKIYVTCLTDSVKAGVEAINKFKPELVFLDVEMPIENGFKLFDYINTISFDIIFTTAHTHYAIDAIKFSALDYLLKPINFVDLNDALKKIERKQVFMNNQIRIETLLYNLNNESDKYNKIALPTSTGYRFEKLNNIMYCVADENYTNVYMIKKEKFLVTKTLKNMEEILPSANFFRIHKSHIVNLNYIKDFNKSDNIITLEDGTILGVAMRRTDDFLNHITYKQKD